MPSGTARAATGTQSARHDFLAPPSPDLPTPVLNLFWSRNGRCLEPRSRLIVSRASFLALPIADNLTVVVVAVT